MKRPLLCFGSMPFFLCLAAISLGPFGARAEVRLPALLSDHAILQRGTDTPVWGWADPGEAVKVVLGKLSAGTVADAAGKWKVLLDLSKADSLAADLEISGHNHIVLHDIVVGQVWLISGQSNVRFRLSRAIGGGKAIARSQNPLIREFSVMWRASAEPVNDCDGQWVEATPQTSAYFSAIGYFFAQILQKELKEPVGIINDCWGGTAGEPWTALSELNRNPDLKAGAEINLRQQSDFMAEKQRYAADLAALLKSTGREDKPTTSPQDYAGENISPEGWRKYQFPGSSLSNPGIAWFRKDVQLRPIPPNFSLRVILGTGKGFETLYWNGQKIGETTPATYAKGVVRTYFIPAHLIREGRNVLALRVFSPLVPPQIADSAKEIVAITAPLAGEWQEKTEAEFSPLAVTDAAHLPRTPMRIDPATRAGYIYNGMVHPALPYGIAGILWYQGETNRGRGYQYRDLLPLLVDGWRNGRNIPFYIFQLPNFKAKTPEPGESSLAELRESQALMAQNTSQCAFATLIDVGEEENIHPRDKFDPADRMARIVLAKAYGRNIVSSGPVFESMTVEGDKVRLYFKEVNGGLVARALPATYQPTTLKTDTRPLIRNSPNSQLEGFAICGGDHKWFWADAKIDGNTIVVWSDKVSRPEAVRYAWADNPTCNLYNAAGLPAPPFRTDHFPGVSQGLKFEISQKEQTAPEGSIQ